MFSLSAYLLKPPAFFIARLDIFIASGKVSRILAEVDSPRKKLDAPARPLLGHYADPVALIEPWKTNFSSPSIRAQFLPAAASVLMPFLYFRLALDARSLPVAAKFRMKAR